MKEGELQHHVERKETIDWQEVRRQSLRDLAPYLSLLAEYVTPIEMAHKQGEGLTNQQIDFIRIFNGIIDAEHLTIGNKHCLHIEHRLTGEKIPGYTGGMRDDIVFYEKGIHEVAVAHPEPEEWVRIIDPFIGDNLLGECVQTARVVPASEREIKEIEELEGPFE